MTTSLVFVSKHGVCAHARHLTKAFSLLSFHQVRYLFQSHIHSCLKKKKQPSHTVLIMHYCFSVLDQIYDRFGHLYLFSYIFLFILYQTHFGRRN
jgi:DNA topoisomerase IB